MIYSEIHEIKISAIQTILHTYLDIIRMKTGHWCLSNHHLLANNVVKSSEKTNCVVLVSSIYWDKINSVKYDFFLFPITCNPFFSTRGNFECISKTFFSLHYFTISTSNCATSACLTIENIDWFGFYPMVLLSTHVDEHLLALW